MSVPEAKWKMGTVDFTEFLIFFLHFFVSEKITGFVPPGRTSSSNFCLFLCFKNLPLLSHLQNAPCNPDFSLILHYPKSYVATQPNNWFLLPTNIAQTRTWNILFLLSVHLTPSFSKIWMKSCVFQSLLWIFPNYPDERPLKNKNIVE